MSILYALVFFIFLIAVIIVFKNREVLTGSYLKYFPYFLLIDLILGIVSYLMPVYWGIYNIWLVNLSVNFELLFVFFLYYHLLKNKRYKMFALITGIVYELFFLVSYLRTDNWVVDYQDVPFFVGSLFAIIVLMLFILDMLASDHFLYIHKYPVFWITVAFLFYYIIPFPTTFWIHLFNKYGSDYLLELSSKIQMVANLLMYITIIFGFIWSKMRYK